MRITLVHGFPGFSTEFGLSYFVGVEDYLNAQFQDLDIFIPALSPPFGLDTTAHRATQLLELLEGRFDATEKIHIIAHSGGGLDARMLASPAPATATQPAGLNFGSRLATVTTIATPHHGALIADLLASSAGEVAEVIPVIDNLADAIRGYTTAAMQDFNNQYVDAPGVQYFSYGGTKFFRAPFQLSGPLIRIKDGPNDGWISVRSATYGQFVDTVDADHFEEVGLDPAGFDHLEFFGQIVGRLGGVRR
jgi:triacylglycerol lipase